MYRRGPRRDRIDEGVRACLTDPLLTIPPPLPLKNAHRWVDWTDRNSCILFGDGAGAMVLAATESEAESGVLGFAMHSDGTGQGDLNLQFAEDTAQSPPSIAGACTVSLVWLHADTMLRSSGSSSVGRTRMKDDWLLMLKTTSPLVCNL